MHWKLHVLFCPCYPRAFTRLAARTACYLRDAYYRLLAMSHLCLGVFQILSQMWASSAGIVRHFLTFWKTNTFRKNKNVLNKICSIQFLVYVLVFNMKEKPINFVQNVLWSTWLSLVKWISTGWWMKWNLSVKKIGRNLGTHTQKLLQRGI